MLLGCAALTTGVAACSGDDGGPPPGSSTPDVDASKTDAPTTDGDGTVPDASGPRDGGGDAPSDAADGGATCAPWKLGRDPAAPASAKVEAKGGKLVFSAPDGRGTSYRLVHLTQAPMNGDFDMTIVLESLDGEISNGVSFGARQVPGPNPTGTIAVYPATTTKHYVQFEGCSAGGHVPKAGPIALRITRKGLALHLEASGGGETFARDCTVTSAPPVTPEVAMIGSGDEDEPMTITLDDFRSVGAGGCADDFSVQRF